MSSPATRIAALGLVGAALAGLTAAVDAPAYAAPAAVASPFPALNPTALQVAIQPRPGENAAGVIARVAEPGQVWRGSSTDAVTGRQIPANAHFLIGSISKVFETTVILQLAADGEIDLDQTVQYYLPGVLPDTYQPITVRELINYTSGLPDVMEGAPTRSVDQVIADRATYRSFEELVQGTLRPTDRPWPTPHFAPGTEQEYNSLGFRIGGLLIERITGNSFKDEVTERIIEPLHLDQTSVPEGELAMPRPYLHAYLADGEGRLVDVSEQGGNPSNIVSTPADLDRFLSALLQGRLLPPAQQAELFALPKGADGTVVPFVGGTQCEVAGKPGPACYGAGLQSIPLPNGQVLWGKTGHDLGYASGVFATRDLSVRGVYAISNTSLDTGPDAVSNRLLRTVVTGR